MKFFLIIGYHIRWYHLDYPLKCAGIWECSAPAWRILKKGQTGGLAFPVQLLRSDTDEKFRVAEQRGANGNRNGLQVSMHFERSDVGSRVLRPVREI
jgi:hypothetical protein